MARRFRVLGRDVVVGKRLFGVGKDEDYWGMVPMLGNDSESASRLEAYRGVVYACVNLIGESFGSYQPIFRRMQGDQLEEVKDHEFLRLLQRPSGLQPTAEPLSQYDMWEAVGSFLELQGEVYLYMGKGSLTGIPREIVILRADKVGIDVDKNTGAINGYFIRRNAGSPIPLEVNEVLHFKRFNPTKAYHGMGTVEAGHDYIKTDEYTTTFTKNFFRNNAGLNGVLSISGEITKDTFKKLVRAWRTKYEGVDNAGKTAIIRESEANFTKVGLGLNELDMTALRKMSQEDVAMMFRVPLPLLGKAVEGVGLGRGNVETYEYIFAKWVIDKKFQKIDAVLQYALERYWPEDKDIIVDHENIIPDDKEYELALRDKAVDRWRTRDEIRADEGLDKVPGGDQLRAPMATIPISEDAPVDTSDTGKSLVIRRRVVTKKKDSKPEVSVKEAFRLRLMRNQAIYERRFKKVVKPVLAEQLKDALNNLEAHASSLTVNKQQKLFDDAEYDQKIVDALMPTMVDLGEQQGSLALRFAGDESSEFRMLADYEKYVSDRTSRMATKFNDETINRLNATLSEGISEGESLGKLRSRVESVYRDTRGYRAERIARTETLSASNIATREAYRQTGYVKGVKWYVNPGACEICSEVEGKTVGLEDAFFSLGESIEYTSASGEPANFNVDYLDIEAPPLHPNCRCTVVPTTEDGSDLRPSLLEDERGSIGEDETIAYHGDGHNLANGNYALGDAYYVTRDYSSAATFGNVAEVTLPFGDKAILKIHNQKEYQKLVDDAILWGSQELKSTNFNTVMPAYIRHLGFKAAEIMPDFDPLGGIAVVDKSAIP